MLYEKINTKYTNININEYRHSEMGPLRQNPIRRTVRTARLSVLMTVEDIYSTVMQSYNREYGVVMFSDASVCVSVCPSVSVCVRYALSFESLAL